MFCEVFLDQLFFAILVAEVLPIADEERSHVGDEWEEETEGFCSTVELAFD